MRVLMANTLLIIEGRVWQNENRDCFALDYDVSKAIERVTRNAPLHEVERGAEIEFRFCALIRGRLCRRLPPERARRALEPFQLAMDDDVVGDQPSPRNSRVPDRDVAILTPTHHVRLLRDGLNPTALFFQRYRRL